VEVIKMNITDEARAMITGAMNSNGYDCIKAMTQKSCCGTSLYFTSAKLQEGENPVLINGISVLMDNKTRERAETITISVEQGKLVIQDSTSCCC
jgi:hypothetical protein